MRMAEGIRLATSSPVRRPRKISITTMTMATACTRLVTNSSILSVTTCGWKATSFNSMPQG